MYNQLDYVNDPAATMGRLVQPIGTVRFMLRLFCRRLDSGQFLTYGGRIFRVWRQL